MALYLRESCVPSRKTPKQFKRNSERNSMRKKKLTATPQKSRATVKKDRGSKAASKIKPKQLKPPVHPWRVCPYGEHWVRTHPMHVRPSREFPEGHTTIRHDHCAVNPSKKDQLYPEEIGEIANQHFSNLKNRHCPLPLKFGSSGKRYDDLIAGWVQYWNEVLQPDVPLDPNLVKALIASESTFDPKRLYDKTKSNSARGLTQITNETRKLIGGAKGGLERSFSYWD